MGRCFQQAAAALTAGRTQGYWAQPALPPAAALPRMLDPANAGRKEGCFSFPPGASFRVDGVLCTVTEDGALHWTPGGEAPTGPDDGKAPSDAQIRVIPPFSPDKAARCQEPLRADNLWEGIPDHRPAYNRAEQKPDTNRLPTAPSAVVPPSPAPQPSAPPAPAAELPPTPEPPVPQPSAPPAPAPEPAAPPAWMRRPPAEEPPAAAPMGGAWKKSDHTHPVTEEELP